MEGMQTGQGDYPVVCGRSQKQMLVEGLPKAQEIKNHRQISKLAEGNGHDSHL